MRTAPTLGSEVVTKAIIYTTEDLPPHTLFIPLEEYKLEDEDRRIKEDIARRKAEAT